VPPWRDVPAARDEDVLPFSAAAAAVGVCSIFLTNRPSYQRTAKSAPFSHEDEKFAFIVLEKAQKGRGGAADAEEGGEGEGMEGEGGQEGMKGAGGDVQGLWGRLIRRPLMRKGHVIVDYCGSEGRMERAVVSKGKSEGEYYRTARKLAWGDTFEHRATAARIKARGGGSDAEVAEGAEGETTVVDMGTFMKEVAAMKTK
jgi:ribosomal protein RSM22 (predicted rRNA methylase)